MEKMKLWMIAAILFCGMGCLNSCNGNKTAPFDDVAATAAVAQYMVDSIGSQYAQGEVCIPSVSVIAIDKVNPDSIKLWGDYWVFNYNIVGDTLPRPFRPCGRWPGCGRSISRTRPSSIRR